MRGASVLVFLGLYGHWVAAQFLNNRPFPTYSLENMPDTEFSCRDKILGGYYADPETQCQMFHVCVKVAGVGIQDFRFLCPNGTAFDQDHQICADWEDVDCDATTLYYSSDNFDLYRIGSGYESKAHKYGEDEETFALQRAETGDTRLNREHQSNSVNQQKQASYSGRPRTPVNRNNNNNNNNSEKDIFKGSSSSNFFNNRNNGKERDEDYDENVNVNQDRDFEQRRKVVRNKIRRPAQSNRQNQNVETNRGGNHNQNADQNRGNNNQNGDSNRSNNNQNADYTRGTNNNQNGNINRGTTNNNNQNADYTRGTNNQNGDNNRGTNTNQNGDYSRTNNQNVESNRNNNNNNADYNRRNQNDYTTKADFDPTKRPTFINNFAGSSYIPTTSRPSSTTNDQSTTVAPSSYRTRPAQRTREYDSPSPTYTISTPAPFKQTQQYNPPPVRASSTTTTAATDNYPQQRSRTTQEPAKPRQQTTQSQNYESTKIKYDKTENYPSNNPQYFEKKPTTPFRQQAEKAAAAATTQAAPRSFATFPTIPTTFAPRTSAAYAQLAQQTKQQAAKLGTSKATPFTQYTPTVPKVASTTPIARSSRYDETQYDDGSYNPKYDYDADKREDEFLRTAHSQNIAASRNEYAKATTKQLQQQQQPQQTQRTTAYESPRPFSVTTTTSTAQPPRSQPEAQKTTPRNGQAAVKANLNPKKTKDASYDYAYYDTGVGSEPDYDVNTEIKKSTVKN